MNFKDFKPLIAKYEVVDHVVLPMLSGTVVCNAYGYALKAKIATEAHTEVITKGLSVTINPTQYIPLSTECSWEEGKDYHTAEISIIRAMSLSRDEKGNWTVWKSNEKAPTFLRVTKLCI